MSGADQPSLASNARSNPTCAPAKAIASSPEDSDSFETNPTGQKDATPRSSPRAAAATAGLDHTLTVSPIWRSKLRTRGAVFTPSPSEGKEAGVEENPALFSCTCIRERRDKQVSTYQPDNSNPIQSNPITSAIDFQVIFRSICVFADPFAGLLQQVNGAEHSTAYTL